MGPILFKRIRAGVGSALHLDHCNVINSPIRFCNNTAVIKERLRREFSL
jgi:hypothetical protein